MPNTLSESVISIWIPNQGFVTQGKFCEISGKSSFVANMTERKLWVKFGGYSIAKRILDKLPSGTQIIYKREDLNTHYTTNKTAFQKKGILVAFGGHSQWILPLKNWKTTKGKLENEPRDLPVMNLDEWLKTDESKKKFDIYDLKREWQRKYA